MRNSEFSADIIFARSKCQFVIWCLLLFSFLLSTPADLKAATISCSNGLSGCHFSPRVQDGTARNVPDGQFTGSHTRHSGYSTINTKRQYQFACTKCHGLSGGYNNAHQSGFKNVSGSSLPKAKYSAGAALNGRIPNSNSPTFGNCTVYCHSSGRSGVSMPAANLPQYSSVRWGGTEGCLGCHGGRAISNGNPARSVGNFTLTTTHSQHLKYPAANINCQMCHSKTATDAATLKSYTAAYRHANGVRDVTFSAAAGYGSYTSYKSTESGSAGTTRTCNNVSCHGGKTRGAWINNATNNDHTCVHCHGVAGSTTLRADFYNAAPGWATTGTSTDQLTSNTDKRVGAHFAHLSSVYMAKLKCNECHAVPAANNPFSVSSHMGSQSRYNSQTLTFAQATTAKRNTTTPAFTAGTAVAAATCSTTYCHGGNMLKGDTSGLNRSVNWDQSTLMTGTPGADCGTCHGNPPTAGTTSGTHSSYVGQPTTSCVTCHASVVDATGKIINKSLHINGTITATGGHEYSFGGWRHMPGGVGSITATGSYPFATNCSCHTPASGGSYPVTRGSAAAIVCSNCHTNWANFSGANPGCYDCHGRGKGSAINYTTARPNGAKTAFPNWSGSHNQHIAEILTCNDCHNNAGTGKPGHGNYSSIVKTRADVTVSFNTAKAGASASYSYNGGLLTCSTVYCHSTGRATGMGTSQYTNPNWGTKANCLQCHGGRNPSTNNYARSAASYTLSTTHSQHLKYGTADMNCNICHAETAADHKSLNPTTGQLKHADGTRQVNFTNIGYASYTSFKSTESGSSSNAKICTNTSCHGGRTRSAWSASAPPTTNTTCTHCHGVDGSTSLRADKRNAAPGWGGIGTSTDGNSASTDVRVGAHYVHLSSIYIKKFHCNECHTVPETPFGGGNHTLNTLRYNSNTLTFVQSSTAKITIGVASGSNPTQLSVFTGYTNGTAIKAATCSSVYCHGNRMKNNITSGTARKPSWNQDLTATPATATSCGRCHGYPPLDGGLHTAGDTTCSGCHSHVGGGANPTAFTDKSKHIDGRVQMSMDCANCHNATTPSAAGTSPANSRRQVWPTAAGTGEFKYDGTKYTNLSSHVRSGTMISILTCQICHYTASGHKTFDDGAEVRLQNTWAAGFINYTTPMNSRLSYFCTGCHRSSGYGGSIPSGSVATATQPFKDSGSTKTPADIFGDWSSAGQFTGTSAEPTALTTTGNTTVRYTHRKAADCLDCHGDNQTDTTTTPRANAHASKNGRYLRYSTSAGKYETQTCFNTKNADGVNACHGPGTTLTWAGANVYSEFKVNNASAGTGGAHPILQAVTPKSTNISADTTGTRFVNGWKSNSIATCSDCHGGSSGARGPHGSTLPFIVIPAPATSPTQTTSGTTFTAVTQNTRSFCLRCHAAYYYGDGNGNPGAGAGTMVGHGSTNPWSGTSNCSGPTRSYMNNSCQNCHCGRGFSGTGQKGTHSTTATVGGATAHGVGFANGNIWMGGPWGTGSTSGCYAISAATNYGNCNKGANHASSDSRFKKNIAAIINPLRALLLTDAGRYGGDVGVATLIDAVKSQQQQLTEQEHDLAEIRALLQEKNR